MPTCRECGGTGKIQEKVEITTRCPDCDAAKILPDGSECKRCNQWGEIGTGEFKIEEKLCTNCWGSGRVSEGSLTTWFLVRVVPTTLIVLGLGGVAIWAVWNFVGIPWAIALITIIVFGLWGGLMYHFTRQMHLPSWYLAILIYHWYSSTQIKRDLDHLNSKCEKLIVLYHVWRT